MINRARTLTILGMLLLAARMASGQAIDALRRSTTITGSDLLYAQTNSAGAAGQKYLTAITASNFLESLKLFPGWPSGLGTLSGVKTNGVNVSSTASSVNFVAGTNVVLRATNTAGAVTVEINSASGSGSGDVSTAQLNAASNAAISSVSGTLKSYATNIATLPSIYTNVVYVNATNSTVSLATIVSNAPARTLVEVGPGYYNGGSLGMLRNGVPMHFHEGAIVTFTDTGETSYFFHDENGPITNSITGMGTFIITNATSCGGIWIQDPKSDVFIECKKIWVQGDRFAVDIQSGKARVIVHDEIRSDTYDTVIIGSPGSTPPAIAHVIANAMYAGDSLWEHNAGATNWGEHMVVCNYAEALPGTGSNGKGTIQLHDRGIFEAKTIFLNRTNAVISSSTTNEMTVGGVIRGATIYNRSDSKHSIIEPELQYGTALTLEDCTVDATNGKDPFVIYNFSPFLQLRNTSVKMTSAATNWVRPFSGTGTVVIAGPINLNPPKLQASGIGIRGNTNLFVGIHNYGNLTNSGSARIGGILTVDGQSQFNGAVTLDTTASLTGNDGTFETLNVNQQLTAVKIDATEGVKIYALSGPAVAGVNASGDLTNLTLGAGLSLIGTTLSGTSSGTIGAGAMAANANQFDTNNQLNIKTGALLTNVQARGITDLNATVSRAAAFNASGNLTNATTTAAELDFVSGVTSAIQTQLNGKQTGLTNGNQFGATTTTTIKSGALVTNVQARGVTDLNLTASRAVVLNASGNLTNATTTAAELDFVNGVTSAIQTQLNGKQNGQTNGNQFGASTTLTIASGALTTNAQIRGLTPLGLTASRATFIDASGNLTNVTSGSPSTEYVKADGTTGTPSGGTGSTNPVTFAAGSVYITNSIQMELEPMVLRTTNMWADGGNGSMFTNIFTANLGGVTNILATNILDGQTITLWVWADTGVTVGLPQFTATNYVDGSVIPIMTNAWSVIRITRTGTFTNINVGTPSLSIAPGSGVTFSTNFVSRTLTVNATGSGGGATTNANQFGATTGELAIKSGALLTNVQARGVTDLNLTASRAVVLNASGNLTNATTTAAELDFVNGVTSAIQTQLNGKQNGQTNANQFGASTTITIASGALVTNLSSRGVTIPSITVSRAVVVNASGNLTNAAATTDTEIGFVNGVTSAIQTQLNSKQNGATNAQQFGASTTLTIKNGVTTTNLMNYATPSLLAGVGGANTNFTLLATNVETTINGFTNVSIRAVMVTDTANALYWNCLITNGSGSDRTLEFSAVTNNFRFSGTYGTNAPSVLTNNTQILISGRSLGTNTIVGYSYFPWP